MIERKNGTIQEMRVYLLNRFPKKRVHNMILQEAWIKKKLVLNTLVVSHMHIYPRKEGKNGMIKEKNAQLFEITSSERNKTIQP